MPIAATTARKAPIAAVLCSAVVGAVLLAGCGSRSASGLSRGEASRLDGHIEALRAAAAANDDAGAQTQLQDLVGDVSDLRRAGRLSAAQARNLTADVAQLQATVTAMLAPSSRDSGQVASSEHLADAVEHLAVAAPATAGSFAGS